jgi:hypothetical protein
MAHGILLWTYSQVKRASLGFSCPYSYKNSSKERDVIDVIYDC